MSVSMFAIYRHDLTKCRAPHMRTFLNIIMVVMNYSLVDKHGIYPATCRIVESEHISDFTKKWSVRVGLQSVGVVNITLSIKCTSYNKRIFPYHRG